MATESSTGAEMVPCSECGKMVPEWNMTLHRINACSGKAAARPSTSTTTQQEDEEKTDDNISNTVSNDDDDDDDDVIDLCDEASPKNGDDAPTTPPRRRRRRQGRLKRDDDEEDDDPMEIDDDDDEVEVVENNNSNVVDLVDEDDKGKTDEWACSQCTLLNNPFTTKCEACGHVNRDTAPSTTTTTDGVRAADPVRRERLIGGDDDFDDIFGSSGAGGSPIAALGAGALFGGAMGAAGAYMRGSPVSSGAINGGVAGAVGSVFMNEIMRDLNRSAPSVARRSSRSSFNEDNRNSLASARSAAANGQPTYPVTGTRATRRSTRNPRPSFRVTTATSPDGRTTTIVSQSGRAGSTRMVRRSTHPEIDQLMGLLVGMQGDAFPAGLAGRRGSAGDVDRMSYEQILAAFGNGSENMGASGGTISALPTAKVKTKADGTIDLPADACECSICLEAFEQGQTRKTLPCLHGFHEDCVDKWLVTNGACPVCKFRVDQRDST